jgi:hypothetical protein
MNDISGYGGSGGEGGEIIGSHNIQNLDIKDEVTQGDLDIIHD